jgi:NitT/TauT family transport system substrate-binding protein
MDRRAMLRCVTAALTAAALAGCAGQAAAPHEPVVVKMSLNETLLPALAESLGYFRDEGLRIEEVDVEPLMHEDFLIQEPMNRGQVDAAYHWFHHAYFGARHNWPVTAVVMLNDAPGVQVMVSNQQRDRIRNARDFAGRNVAQGAGYSTKSVVVNYLALRSGLPPHSYRTVLAQTEGREAAVMKGLKDGQVDVLAFLEPMTSTLLATGQVTTLYDFTRRENVERVFGAPWPAQSLLVAPRLIRDDPQTVQHLVNAYVRTMRYVNRHSAEEIIAQLPASYFEKRDRAQETQKLRNTMAAFAQGDYSFPASGVDLVVRSALASDFDDSPEGRWRRGVENANVDPSTLYDNRFVLKAMREIP